MGSKNSERKHNKKRKTIYHWTHSKLIFFPLFKLNCSGWICRKPEWPQWASRLSGHQEDPLVDQLEHPARSVGICRSSVPAFSRSPRDSSVSDTSNKGDRAAGESTGTSWKLFTDVSWENRKPREQGSMCVTLSQRECSVIGTQKVLYWYSAFAVSNSTWWQQLLSRYSNIPDLEILDSQTKWKGKAPWHSSNYLQTQNLQYYLHVTLPQHHNNGSEEHRMFMNLGWEQLSYISLNTVFSKLN